MFFSPAKKDEGRIVGIIDIGSARVSGAIIKQLDREVVSVLAESDEKISYHELPEFNHFWEQTKLAIQTLLKELRSKAGANEPEKIFIFLSSPFFQSQTKVIRVDNSNSIKITKAYLIDLIKKADREMALEGETVILEDKVMQTKLDGYITTWPVGQKAQEVILSRFLSWADKDLLVNLRDLMRAEYAKAPVIFNTFSFATYDIFKDFLPEKDFILLDVGNEITDILVVKDNVLAEHFSFPKGKNFLVRSLAKELGTIPAEVETSLNLLTTGQANQQLKNRLGPALRKVERLWQADFKQTLTLTLETSFLPETVYLISDDPADSLFIDFVNQAELSEITLSNNKLDTVFVEKLLADGLAHLTGKTQPLTNSWLLAEALFCAKIKWGQLIL